jgi:hypothetical protein
MFTDALKSTGADDELVVSDITLLVEEALSAPGERAASGAAR